MLGGFASPSEGLGPLDEALRVIARALCRQSGELAAACDQLTGDGERRGTSLPELPDDFGSLPEDD